MGWRRSRRGMLNGSDGCIKGGLECLGNCWEAGGVCRTEEGGLGGRR